MSIGMSDIFSRRNMLRFLPNVSVAILLSYISFAFFPKDNGILTAMNLLGISIVIFPFLLTRYISYNARRQTEENFPLFLRDFVETIRGGLTVPAAFQLIAKNDYGPLNKYVRKIAAQLEWGIPVDKVLLSFAKETKSPLISRVVSSVVESHRYGGRLAETFDALSHTAVEVDRLKAERKFFLQSQMMTGYIIFFVFLGVIISLETFLVPSITRNPPTGLTESTIPPQVIAQNFQDIFRNLILIQGLFAGLSVGKMAEGAVIAGVKHSLIMMLSGGIVFFLFGNIPLS